MSHQKLVLDVEKKVRSIGLLPKPSECRSLSIQKGTLEIVDFNLPIDACKKVLISFVLVKPLKFLGSVVAEENSPSTKFAIIEQKLREKLENIDLSEIGTTFNKTTHEQAKRIFFL